VTTPYRVGTVAGFFIAGKNTIVIIDCVSSKILTCNKQNQNIYIPYSILLNIPFTVTRLDIGGISYG